MADVKGLVSDPNFQKLDAASQRQALAGVTGDQSFSNLSDDDTKQFISRVSTPVDPITQQMNATASAAGIANPGVSHPAVDPVLQEARRYSSTLDPQDRYLYNLSAGERPQAEEIMSAGSSMEIPIGVASAGMLSPVGTIANQGLTQGLKSIAVRAVRPLIGTAIGAEAGQRIGRPIGKLLGDEEAGATVGSYAGGAIGAGAFSNPDKLSEVPFLGRFLTTDDEYADVQAERTLARQQAMERAVANNPDVQQRALGAFMNKGYQNVGDTALNPYAPTGATGSADEPFEPLIYSSPQEYDQQQIRLANLKRQASAAGTYHAAQGSASRRLNLQQRIANRIASDPYSPTR